MKHDTNMSDEEFNSYISGERKTQLIIWIFLIAYIIFLFTSGVLD